MQSCFTYTDEVMLREAAGSNVVLQQLLGEVLVHLSCFMGIHCIPKGLVQVCKRNKWSKLIIYFCFKQEVKF